MKMHQPGIPNNLGHGRFITTQNYLLLSPMLPIRKPIEHGAYNLSSIASKHSFASSSIIIS
jgi:hypothetical protein